MTQIKYGFLLIFSLIPSLCAFSQSDTVIYDNEIYVDYIKGVTFHINGLPTSIPIIGVDGGKLSLSFDDMGGSFYDYTYHIVHCDKDWRPSNLNEIEYLDGFNGQLIESFTSSEFTYEDYTHYSLTFPNRDLDIISSGNYLLIINDEDDLPIITRRFIVVDAQISVEAEMKKSVDQGTFNTHQGVSFKLVDKQGYVSNPNDETFVRIIQNGRWESGYHNLRPDNSFGGNIVFNMNRPYSFPGHKEFRNFDIRTLEAATRNVHSIDLLPDGTKAILKLSKNRQFGNYQQENDANGSFVVDNQNDVRYEASMENPYRGAITGDYVDVYFTLKTMEIYDSDVYVIGQFSDWKAREEFRLSYSAEKNHYVGNAFFKQGYYDYYFAVKDESGNINTETLEGNHFMTENDYLIIVYNRSYGKNYDEVIAISQINSIDNR